MSQTIPPAHARPSHHLTTPRLIIRTASPTDVRPFTLIRQDPKNSPYGGVVNSHLTEEEQAGKLAGQTASTARGENAFLVIILKDSAPPITITETEEERAEKEKLRVHDGLLIGMTGYNCFPVEDGELIGNTGALIDWRFVRKGYAMETLEAVFELGFNELGVGIVEMETEAENVMWRGLMARMGVRVWKEKETEAVFRVGKGEWAGLREKLKLEGRWFV